MMFFAMFPFLLFYLFLLCYGFRTAICPDCGQPMSGIKKTRRQWIEGGFVCSNCGCVCDLAGRKVAPGAPIRRIPLFALLGLITLFVAGAGLIYALLHVPSSPPLRARVVVMAQPRHDNDASPNPAPITPGLLNAR